MDRLDTTTPASDFRTPPRILIPKLVSSRDKWKVKATDRKHRLHQEKIHSRDLSLSRQRWKDRALAAELKIQELQLQLERSQSDIAQLQDDLQKK
ncbi:MAG TPA: hypothetical protein DEV93_21980 [Chloroflexi bacterium]|nr:hypothetical protein [Chloroflexota bacterium]